MGEKDREQRRRETAIRLRVMCRSGNVSDDVHRAHTEKLEGALWRIVRRVDPGLALIAEEQGTDAAYHLLDP